MLPILESRNGKKILNGIFSIGAAVVIVGALGKINHTSWGGPALTAGMVTEVCIFILMAFIPPDKEYHWEKVIPNLNISPEEDKNFDPSKVQLPLLGGAATPSPLHGLEEMLKQADITPVNLKRLSDNFQRLNSTVEKMSEIGDMVSATGDYAQKTKEAAQALTHMTQAYNNAAHAVASFSAASESTKQFHEQVQSMTKNLASLNAIYELELQDTNNHLKAMNSFYTNLLSASQTMSQSAEDAKTTQTQIALLAKNLTNLNAVYGNMLSAMQGR